jgi:hypothetical protein
VLARNKLENFLLDSYGGAAFFTPLKSEPPKPRFAVFVQESGLSVKVTLTDKESRAANQEVNGVPFTEFAALLPKTFESFTVKTIF